MPLPPAACSLHLRAWVAVKELNLSYYSGDTILIAIYTHYGNLIYGTNWDSHSDYYICALWQLDVSSFTATQELEDLSNLELWASWLLAAQHRPVA